MAKKSTKTRQKRKRRKHDEAPVVEESRRSVALTVAWMMCTLATLAAMILFAIASFVMVPAQPVRSATDLSAVFSAATIFTAVVSGSLALLLIPVTYRVRQAKPPIAITVGSILISATPWLVLLLRSSR